MKSGMWLARLLAVAAISLAAPVQAASQTPEAPPAQAAPPAAPAPSDAATADLMAKGRQNTEWFYAKELDRVWETFSDSMKKRLETVEKVRMMRDQIDLNLGAESSIVEEKVGPDLQGRQAYTRTAKFEKAAEQAVNLQWSFDAGGKVDGFAIFPAQMQPTP
jgi:3-oxoacyl-ACP reductase-like protein